MQVRRSATWLARVKARFFPNGVRRWTEFQRARVLERTSEADFAACFRSLEIPPGAVVCIHAAMSGFGYLCDGMQSVFTALQKTVPDVTLVMPSFPFNGSTVEYLQGEPVFDRARTPSQSGALSETLRKMPGVQRGLHPTHACLALGPRGQELIDGTEESLTPFGDDSTYGRYSRLPNAVLLLLHTNSTSHVHRLQELVAWPNLFLPGAARARGYDASRRIRTYEVRVHRPRLPLFPVVDAGRGERRYLWLPDYAVQFPTAKREQILARLADTPAADLLVTRQRELLDTGVFRVARCGPGEVMAIDLAPWQARMCADLRRSFEDWREAYSLEALSEADRKGLLR